MDPNFEAGAFSAAFPGKPLAGFLAMGEIFGEVNSPPGARLAAALDPTTCTGKVNKSPVTVVPLAHRTLLAYVCAPCAPLPIDPTTTFDTSVKY